MSSKAFYDVEQITDRLTPLAAEHSVSCGILAICDTDVSFSSNGSFSTDDKLIVDGAGGFFLGMTVLHLIGAGVISEKDAVSKYVSNPVLPEQLTVEQLLSRTTSLPDPLRQTLLPHLHREEEFMELTSHEKLCHEHTAMLEHRHLDHQFRLLAKSRNIACLRLAPSPLEESLLVEIVEKASGMTLREYQTKHFFSSFSAKDYSAGADGNTMGRLAYAEKSHAEYYAPDDLNGLYSMKLTMLGTVISSLTIDRIPNLDDIPGYKPPQALPMGLRQGLLVGRSQVCGFETVILCDRKNKLCVILACTGELLPISDGAGGFRRFDTDAVKCINSLRIRKDRLQLEPLSSRCLGQALSLSPAPEQTCFVPSAAMTIAESMVTRRSEMAVRTGGRQVFVLRDDPADTLVGLLAVTYEPSANRAHLETLVIDQFFQRMGLGGSGLQLLYCLLRREGYKRITACVDRRNSGAMEFYRLHGFETVAVHPSAYVVEKKL